MKFTFWLSLVGVTLSFGWLAWGDEENPSSYTFPNRSRLVYLAGEKPAVFFDGRDGRRTLIVRKKALRRPTNETETAVKESPSVVTLVTETAVYWVTQEGKFGTLPLDLEHYRLWKDSKNTRPAYTGSYFEWKGKPYYTYSFPAIHPEADATGITFVIRTEEPQVIVYDQRFQAGEPIVEGDTLHFSDSPTVLDLAKWIVFANRSARQKIPFAQGGQLVLREFNQPLAYWLSPNGAHSVITREKIVHVQDWGEGKARLVLLETPSAIYLVGSQGQVQKVPAQFS